MDNILTLQAAAELLQTTDRLLSDNIKAGSLKAYKMGKRIYILESELIAFIRQHPYKVGAKKAV
jgi:excisionase family DNA binding protein